MSSSTDPSEAAVPVKPLVERLAGGPIIVPHMDGRIGSNINGPSLIRVPEWLPNPLGVYYLYFADHKGDYIRLAYADRLEGPWQTYEPGTLQLAESHFPTEPPATAETQNHRPRGETAPHIASPDVHVEEGARQIRMYYHGLLESGRQGTRVALSADGIHFAARPELLGNPYFRVFRHGGWHYAVGMPGVFYRSADGLSGFERGPQLFGNDMRHTALKLDGGTLLVFYTNAGDCPERVLLATVELGGDWHGWTASAPVVVLEPEMDYEGAVLPLVPSARGAIDERVRQLRDPAVYEEHGRTYLLYAVAGESGIALAELHGASAASLQPPVSRISA